MKCQNSLCSNISHISTETTENFLYPFAQVTTVCIRMDISFSQTGSRPALLLSPKAFRILPQHTANFQTRFPNIFRKFLKSVKRFLETFTTIWKGFQGHFRKCLKISEDFPKMSKDFLHWVINSKIVVIFPGLPPPTFFLLSPVFCFELV